MLPHFATPNRGLAGSPVKVPPPPGFRPTALPVKRAVFGDWTRTATGLTSAQKAGVRYEKRVHVALREQLGYKYHESQVLKFEDQQGHASCIPDGLIKELGCLVIIEIKSQHMAESWWQLRKKYEPVIRFIWPGQRVLLLEICRSLDAAAPYPESYTSVEDTSQFVESGKDGELGVLQWKI